MTDKDRILELIAKKKTGNFTLKDIAALNELQQKYDFKVEDYAKIDTIFDLHYIQKGTPDRDLVEKRWNRFSSKLEDSPSTVPAPLYSFKLKKPLKLAGAILTAAALILVVFNVFLLKNSNSAKKLNIVSTENGSKSKLQMPDGTLIWLNSGSTITYDDHYGIKNRKVNLIGEAYFDVKHDPKHPFTIHTKNLNLKVLGTAFNVRAYKEDNSSEATLIRGSLEVSFPNRPSEKLILKPKEKISVVHGLPKKETINQSNKASKKEIVPLIYLSKIDSQVPTNDIEEISWVENKLIFREKTFRELSMELERWYNINIEIKDSIMLDKKFTGTFKNETFIEAINALKETYLFDYNYNKKDNTVTINPDK